VRGRGSPESRSASLPVRIFYSVAELARAGNIRTYTLLRLLRRNGITFLRSGRAFYVTLDEIRRKIPPLWKSLRAAEALRRGAARENVSQSGPQAVTSRPAHYG
jgi:hypothetical protein